MLAPYCRLCRLGLLPDLDALGGRPVELVALLDAKGSVELSHVGNDPVAAVFARAVWIGDQALAQILIAILASPHLAPAEEEALIAAEAVDHGGRLATQRDLVRLVGN